MRVNFRGLISRFKITMLNTKKLGRKINPRKINPRPGILVKILRGMGSCEVEDDVGRSSSRRSGATAPLSCDFLKILSAAGLLSRSPGLLACEKLGNAVSR